MTYDRVNDGSANAPRIRLQQSLWGMRGLPMNAQTEWTLAEKCGRCRDAGLEAVECWLTPENEAEHAQMLRAHGLALALGHRPFAIEDTLRTVEQAARLGAQYVFCQPADAFTSVEAVVAIIEAGRSAADDAGLPYFVETHRNNYTENLPQTLELVKRIPGIRFVADLSHHVLVGEFYGWEDERAIDRLEPILARTASIHGRVSNGEAVQVDVGDGTGPSARFFVALWARAVSHWLRDAGPGDILPFTSELGPPRYAITLPDGREFSDRWEQAIIMCRLAEEAWRLGQLPA